ncbi:MAG: hypothetical protein H7319_02190 [Spirosoma sp.]|nr:hypothetical protein [Spirosoma sp.]
MTSSLTNNDDYEEPAGPISLLIWRLLVSLPFIYTVLVYISHLTPWPVQRSPGIAARGPSFFMLAAAMPWACVMQPERQWTWVGRTLGVYVGYAFFTLLCLVLGSAVGIRPQPLRLSVTRQDSLRVLEASVLADSTFREYYRDQCPESYRPMSIYLFYNGNCLQIGNLHTSIGSSPNLRPGPILPGVDTTIAPLPRLLAIRYVLGRCGLKGIERDGARVVFVELLTAMRNPLYADGVLRGPARAPESLRIRSRYLHVSRYESIGNGWYFFEVNGLSQSDKPESG